MVMFTAALFHACLVLHLVMFDTSADTTSILSSKSARSVSVGASITAARIASCTKRMHSARPSWRRPSSSDTKRSALPAAHTDAPEDQRE